jgi:hypothetical protein
MNLTATTQQAIINQLYNEADINQCIDMYSGEMCDDIRQELVISLYAMPIAKLKAMYNRGELKYYSIAAVRNMSFSSTSAFQRKYNRDYIQMSRDKVFNGYQLTLIDDENKEKKQQAVDDYFNKAKSIIQNYKYKNEKYKYIYNNIFDLYFNQMLTIRQIAKKTHISPNSVFTYLTFIKTIIKQQLPNNPKKYDYDD